MSLEAPSGDEAGRGASLSAEPITFFGAVQAVAVVEFSSLALRLGALWPGKPSLLRATEGDAVFGLIWTTLDGNDFLLP